MEFFLTFDLCRWYIYCGNNEIALLYVLVLWRRSLISGSQAVYRST